MLQAFDSLRRTDEPAGAAAHRIALAGLLVHLAHRMAAADRANIRKLESFRAFRTLILHRSENLRNDVAGALHDNRVADAHVLAFDLVLVVKRGVLHHDTADGDGLELGRGGERAGAADLDFDVAQDCGCLLGGKFMGDGRRGERETKPSRS